MTIIDKLLVKGNHIVIPTNMHHDYLETLHTSHLGVNKTLMQACTTVFWPGMTADITALISNCHACQKFQSKQPPETQPWTSLATNIFELNGKSYLIVVDCYSRFIVVCKVTDHSAEQTIAKFLEIFSEFGVPDEICSDRGTNYTSSLFLEFCKGLDIKLSFSSAYHHSGNLAEHSVQIVKNIIRKCKYTNTNWRLGLLEYLGTPLIEKLASPTKLLAGRQFKGLQPTLHPKLTPNTSFSVQVKEQLVAKKEMENSQHDKFEHDLHTLAIGSTVMYDDHRSVLACGQDN